MPNAKCGTFFSPPECQRRHITRLICRTAAAGGASLPRFVLTQGHGVGTEVWYAAKIIEQIEDVREAMARGSRDQILHNALHLGALMKEANTQVAWGVTLGQVAKF